MMILVIGADHFNRALGSSPADRPQPIDHTPGGKVISTKPMNSGSAPNARFPKLPPLEQNGCGPSTLISHQPFTRRRTKRR